MEGRVRLPRRSGRHPRAAPSPRSRGARRSSGASGMSFSASARWCRSALRYLGDGSPPMAVSESTSSRISRRYSRERRSCSRSAVGTGRGRFRSVSSLSSLPSHEDRNLPASPAEVTRFPGVRASLSRPYQSRKPTTACSATRRNRCAANWLSRATRSRWRLALPSRPTPPTRPHAGAGPGGTGHARPGSTNLCRRCAAELRLGICSSWKPVRYFERRRLTDRRAGPASSMSATNRPFVGW